MKLKSTTKITALALAGVALWGSQPQAQAATVAGSNGDLILAFRDPTNTVTNNLMVDIGPEADYAAFATANPGVTISLNLGSFATGYTSYFASTYTSGGLSAADLTTAYTSSWASLTNPLAWSVFGYSGASTKTLYSTFSSSTGPANEATSGAYNGAVNTAATEWSSLIGATSLSSPEAANLTQPYTVAITDNGSGGNAYGLLDQSPEATVASTGSVSMDLWKMVTSTSSALPPNSADIGTFTLSSNGNFTFTAAGAVPEPSTLGLLGAAGAALGLVRRRRTVVA